jgi:hypothetical protein
MLFTLLVAAAFTVPSSLATLVFPGGGRTVSTGPYSGQETQPVPGSPGIARCIGCVREIPASKYPGLGQAAQPVPGGVREIPASKYFPDGGDAVLYVYLLIIAPGFVF